MSPLIARRRGRVLASITAATLVAGTATLTTLSSPASSAPAKNCTPAADITDLSEGDTVFGLTVSKGVEPEQFTGEVIGVLDDGIAPDLDMVIIDFTGDGTTPVDRAGGIWAGMSGSPVYTEGGDLIGAVAYGLAWGPSPIAGITPFTDMDDYLDSAQARPATRAKVDGALARRIARESDVSQSQASQGFRRLGIPMGISGVGADRLAKLTHGKRSYFPRSSYVAGRVAPAAASADDVVAGGNLAASYSYGDITMGGVGTATSVCDDEVVGFGHPLDFLGETTASLHPASALYIQPDSLGAPFKVANFAPPVGTIDQDRLAGISGFFGETPEGAQIRSELTYGSRSRTGSSTVTVQDAWPSVTFYQQLANHDRVVDAITKGSESQRWTITGSADGKPFTFAHSDKYVSQYDISYDASYELADLVYLLSGVEGIDLDRVDVTGDVSKSTATYRLAGQEQRRGGAWVPVNRKNPATVKAGRTLRMRTVLRGSDGSTARLPYSFAVPKKARGDRGFVYLTGGQDYYSEEYLYDEYGEFSSLSSIAEVQKYIAGLLRNDEVSVAMYLGSAGGGEEEECRGCRAGGGVEKSTTIGPADKVVSGYKRVKVVVKK